MKKRLSILILGLFLCLYGCSTDRPSESETENVFETIEGSRENGYQIKDLTWGMSKDEVRQAINQEGLESDSDRLILNSSECDDFQHVKIYRFEDETKSNLITVEYTWTVASEDSFQSVVDSLCEYAAQQMETPDSGNDLTKEELLEMNTAAWAASDNSRVNILLSSDHKSVSVQINGPREVPKTLMPSG